MRADEAAAAGYQGTHATQTLVARPPEGRDGRVSCLNVSGEAVGTASRRIAVVPAYNEEPTVEAVLDRLYPMVDELGVVDDGDRKSTRLNYRHMSNSYAA